MKFMFQVYFMAIDRKRVPVSRFGHSDLLYTMVKKDLELTSHLN
jgi:hypothetical protein